MCRMFAYAGPPRDLSPLLVSGGRHLCALAGQHPDGWGIAAWDPGDPDRRIVRSVERADEDAGYRPAVVASRAQRVLVHLRRATGGRVTLANTHPFEMGPWVFAHNGTIPLPLLVRGGGAAVTATGGATDTERSFYRFLAALRAEHGDVEAPLDLAGRVLGELAATIHAGASRSRAPPHQLTFLAMCDEGFVATRYGRPLVYNVGDDHAMIASQPLGPPTGWVEVPERGLVVARPGELRVSTW